MNNLIFRNLYKLSSNCSRVHISTQFIKRRNRCSVKQFHTTPKQYGLMEFFDDEKNWGEKHVQVGRAWKLDELRLKSNQDLHKLWYVLLKEKNMLLSMEAAYNREYRAFPNPERIDKVEISMENLETVVKERNKAYFDLETDETAERPSHYHYDDVGLYKWGLCKEHEEPKRMRDRMIFERLPPGYNEKFIEFEANEKKELLQQDYEDAAKILKAFDNVDMEELQNKYPDIDIQKLKEMKESRGNRNNEY